MGFRTASSRRGFLKSGAAAAAGLLSGCASIDTGAPQGSDAVESGEPFMQDLAAQLYTLRRVLPEKPEETLKALAGIGYKQVEVLQAGFESQAPILKEVGLQPVSMHTIPPVATGNWEAWEEQLANFGRPAPERSQTLEVVIEQALQHGIKFIVVPFLAQRERGHLDAYKKLGERLNQAGETCRKAGIQLCYHNHAFEFEPMEDSTPLATLLDATDPKLLGLELDVFWTSLAGSDPAALLRQYSGRVPLVHLKDKADGTPPQFNESVKPEVFEEVGDGELDFPAILKAGIESGVEHFIVEQDESAGDPLDSLRQSYLYLRSLRV